MPAPLPRSHVGHKFHGYAAPKVVIELFLDLACPFSEKMYNTALAQVAPERERANPGQVEWVVHQVVQPWHPSSALMHEAALAVKEVNPEAFWDFFKAAYDQREDKFIDDVTYDKSRADMYEILSDIAASVGVDRAAVRQKLDLKATGNMGTWMTQELKFTIKFHRKRGVHVTPTVFVNGMEAGQVSSGWTVQEWNEFLDALPK